MEEGRPQLRLLLKVTHCSVYSCVYVCLKRRLKGQKMEYRLHRYPHWIQNGWYLSSHLLFPKDSGWKSWMNWAFGKEILCRASRKSSPEQATSRKVLNQIFFYPIVWQAAFWKATGEADLLVNWLPCLCCGIPDPLHTDRWRKYRIHNPKDTGFKK